MHCFTSLAFINSPLEPYGLLMMDGCAFRASKSKLPFTPIIKLESARIFFYITLIVFGSKKKVIYT